MPWIYPQAQKEIPSDFANCKDKFLVQVKGLEAGEVRHAQAVPCCSDSTHATAFNCIRQLCAVRLTHACHLFSALDGLAAHDLPVVQSARDQVLLTSMLLGSLLHVLAGCGSRYVQGSQGSQGGEQAQQRAAEVDTATAVAGSCLGTLQCGMNLKLAAFRHCMCAAKQRSSWRCKPFMKHRSTIGWHLLTCWRHTAYFCVTMFEYASRRAPAATPLRLPCVPPTSPHMPQHTPT